MPTILTHALLPVLAAAALPRLALSPRLIVVGAFAAMLPDADVIGRSFGIPHTADLGHRGATHTFLFSLMVGALAAWGSAKLQSGKVATFLFVAASCLSHAAADMLTEGGKGIMLLWPLEHARWKFAFHPIPASPVGLQSLRTGTIWDILATEVAWLLFPAALLAGMARLMANWRFRNAR